MNHPVASRIVRLTLNVSDLDRATAFYTQALGFERTSEARGGTARLRLGEQEIALVQAPADAAPYPSPRAAGDPWFQHFAIAVSDMQAACAAAIEHGAEPISRGGPQLLPPSTGGVTAWKFRDPEGHPLELSYIPGSAWLDGGRGPGPCLGVDHTAVAVADLDASVRFYTGLGLAVAGRYLNQGPEQDRLDGLDGAVLDIVALTTPQPGPHIELLHYRTPRPAAPRPICADDLAATRTVLAAAERAFLSDPDGHGLALIPDGAED